MVYLRPETAQGIFVNFLNVQKSTRSPPALRHRPDRQVVPQRDLARQLHLPLPRVRADGMRVFRAARRRPGCATSAGSRTRHALVPRPGHPGEHCCGCASTQPTSWPTTAPAPPTSSFSTPGAGASWRASPTAATTICAQHSRHSGKDLSYVDDLTRRALPPLCDRAGRRRGPLAAGLPLRRLRRGAGQGGPAHRAPPAPLAGTRYKVAVLPLSKKENLSAEAREVAALLRPHDDDHLR